MTTSPISPDLGRVVDALTIRSERAYTLLGAERDFSAGIPAPAPQDPGGERGPSGELHPLVRVLASDLYATMYTRGGPQGHRFRPSDYYTVRAFVDRLSQANCGTGTWERGWKIVEVDEDGRVEVAREWIHLWVTPAQLRVREGIVAPGRPCRVRVGKELRELSPGFYMAIGDGNESDPDDEGPRLVRLYWNLTAGAAIDFLADLTRTLNATRTAFRFKLLSDPEAYRRPDGAVLYFAPRDYTVLAPRVAELHARHAAALRPEVPLFARELAPGLGLAEDPDTGESFGQHRCRVAAQALFEAFQRGVADREGRLAALTEAYRRQGLDPARPYLGARATSDYPRLIAPRQRRERAARRERAKERTG